MIDGRKVNAPLWIIPGTTKRQGKVTRGRTKNNREQVVPLSSQAAAIFEKAIERNGAEHLFPTGHTVKTGKVAKRPHLNKDSVSAAVGRVRRKYGIEDITIHDLRRAITTCLGEFEFEPDIVDRILNHAPDTVTRKHYDFSKLVPKLGPYRSGLIMSSA